jgi:hypothetical protein
LLCFVGTVRVHNRGESGEPGGLIAGIHQGDITGDNTRDDQLCVVITW